MSKLAFVFGIPLFLVLFVGCAKEEKHPIPNGCVNIELYLNFPEYSKLKNEGCAVIAKDPYDCNGYYGNGVVVFKHPDENYGYVAYDATCPKHLEKPTAVRLDGDGCGFSATCPYCNTVYLLDSGYPAEGYPLKKYRVSQQGNLLLVHN